VFFPSTSVSIEPHSFLRGGIASTGTKNERRHAFAALALTLKQFDARQKKPRPKVSDFGFQWQRPTNFQEMQYSFQRPALFALLNLKKKPAD